MNLPKEALPMTTKKKPEPVWYKNGPMKLVGRLVFLSFWAGILFMQQRSNATDILRNADNILVNRRINLRIAIELGIDVSDLMKDG